MLLVGVDGCEAFAGVCDDDCVAEENLILRRDVVENRCDRRKTNVERIQRMLDDRPKVQMKQELQVPVASRQLATSKCNDVKDCLADRVENDVGLRIFVSIEVARLNIAVCPVRKFLQIKS